MVVNIAYDYRMTIIIKEYEICTDDSCHSRCYELLGYWQNIQSDWNINAAEFKNILSLNPQRITCVS